MRPHKGEVGNMAHMLDAWLTLAIARLPVSIEALILLIVDY